MLVSQCVSHLNAGAHHELHRVREPALGSKDSNRVSDITVVTECTVTHSGDEAEGGREEVEGRCQGGVMYVAGSGGSVVVHLPCTCEGRREDGHT